MNLVFIESHNRSDIPLRITGQMSFHSFELVNNDNKIDNDNDSRNSSGKNHIFVHPNELVFRIKEQSMKKSIYFSDRINCDWTIDQLIGKIGRQSATISDPLAMDAVFSYSDWRQSDNHTTPIVTFTPIDSLRHSNKIDLSIDVLVFVDPAETKCTSVGELHRSAVAKINQMIGNYRRSFEYLLSLSSSIGGRRRRRIDKLIALHFQIGIDEILTMILPDCEWDDEDSWRRTISAELKLDSVLQRCQSIFPPADVMKKLAGSGNKLISPHTRINSHYSDCHLVVGRYTYCHYNQDNIDDKGWGCAYRSIQTIVSWFVWQGWSKIDIPTHRDIQLSLVKIGDKQKSFIDSRSWIGSVEVSYVLQDLLKVDSRIISLNKGSELANIYDDLQQHFIDSGAPIMIGGGQLAHTIIGISKDNSSTIRFLILDPHYSGASQDWTTVLSKGWCGWKELSFWKDNLPYNLCLPMLPS